MIAAVVHLHDRLTKMQFALAEHLERKKMDEGQQRPLEQEKEQDSPEDEQR